MSKENELNPEEQVEVDCFNCGNVVTMSAVKLEAMEAFEQEVLCRECDETVEYNEDEEEFDFVPFF